MRDPDQLPNVLHALLAHPALKKLLAQPKVLTTYLQTQAWPETDSETSDPYSMAPDSQEASEAAEIMPLVEQQLADLELTETEKTNLKTALATACPDCAQMAEILMPAGNPNLQPLPDLE
jgi:hypothetical protein